MTELSAVDVSAIAKEVAAQIAPQVAQQIASQIDQAVSQVAQKFTQTTGTVSSRVENADIGGAERLEKDQMADSGILFSNLKRTYDEYQQESLESIKRNRTYVDKVLSDALQFDNQRQIIANQALANLVETGNMVGKQAVRHSDVAIDRQWNVDEQGYTVADVVKAQGAATTTQVSLYDLIVKAVGDALSEKKTA